MFRKGVIKGVIKVEIKGNNTKDVIKKMRASVNIKVAKTRIFAFQVRIKCTLTL